jgi:molybdopterin molybdotransferase
VSMGRHDFVPEALRALDAQLHFHKVRIRPGKPLLFARLAGGALFFGLPGNPVSCAVGQRFFVEPALRAMLGMTPEVPLQAPLASDFTARAPLRFHLKGRVDCDAAGQLHAQVLAGQESFRILPLVASNAWIVLPETIGAVPAGTLVDVHGLGHLQPPAPIPA